MIKEVRYYTNVSAASSSNSDYTIPNGKIFEFTHLGTDTNPTGTSAVEIIWDPSGDNEKIIYSVTSTVQSCTKQFTGDGTKVLRIKLTNNDSVSRTFGGFFIGHERDI